MTRRNRIAQAALLTLLVTGCSSGSSTDTPGASPTATVPEASPSVPSPVENNNLVLMQVKLDDVVAQVSATAPDSVDAAGNPVNWDIANVLDGDLATAWRVAGDGHGAEIVLDLGDTIDVYQVCVIPGYLPSFEPIDPFFEYRRIIAAEMVFADDSSEPLPFGDDPIPGLTCFTYGTKSTDSVRIRIESTTAHGGQDFTAISEIEVWGYVLVP